LRQEAYVWQLSWTPAVRESVRQARDFAGVIVLAAEVDLRPPAPRVNRVPLDGESLKGLGKPVGAALRVSTVRSRFAEEPRTVQFLQTLIRGVAAEARSKGIALAEIQLDYDCPESKLADYRDVLPVLRQAASPIPLTITALPSWMRQRRAYRTLVEQADGYVLQLHSLARPVEAGREIIMLDAASARGWVETAAGFGLPFRAALPTYGYKAAFDAEGNLVSLLAEGPVLLWSTGVTVRTAHSDPVATAGVIRGWLQDRPAELTGILWFRLPVAGDRMNWPWSTLRAVREGRAPQVALRSVVREPEPGLVEVDLLNAGEAEAPWPSPVRIHWRGKAAIAADGLAVYRIVPGQQGEIRLEGTGAGLLRPGDRRTIAWLRFAARTEVEVELP